MNVNLLNLSNDSVVPLLGGYGNKYLWSPTEAKIFIILVVLEEWGFPVMMGLLDFMHWCWKYYPISNQGQERGKENKPTVIIKAVATHDL